MPLVRAHENKPQVRPSWGRDLSAAREPASSRSCETSCSSKEARGRRGGPVGRRWIWAPQLCACILTHALPSPPAPTARRTVSPHPPGAIKRHRRLGCGREGVEEGALNQHFILQRTWSPCLFRDTKPGRARACCITQGSTSSGLSLRQLDSSPQPSQILEPARSTQLTSFRVGRQSWAQKQFQQT